MSQALSGGLAASPFTTTSLGARRGGGRGPAINHSRFTVSLPEVVVYNTVTPRGIYVQREEKKSLVV